MDADCFGWVWWIAGGLFLFGWVMGVLFGMRAADERQHTENVS